MFSAECDETKEIDLIWFKMNMKIHELYSKLSLQGPGYIFN